MSQFCVVKKIAASQEVVFHAVSNIDRFAEIIPQIAKVQFLSEQQVGVGTKFLETRNMNGRMATVELEVTEYQSPERCRIVSDTNGCVWDTLFSVTRIDDTTQLEMTMDARPYRLMARIMNLLIRPMITKAIESDMEYVRQHCESISATSSSSSS